MATSAILIEEQTGLKRRLELRHGGLPFRGVTWGGETKLVTQFYPGGNKRGSQQVLAPTVTPTDWQGLWRTHHLVRDPCMWTAVEGGAPQPVGFPHTLWEIFESLRDEAQLLRVTWTVQSAEPTQVISNRKDGTRKNVAENVVQQRQFKVVRVGRLRVFDPKPDTVDDIPWSATFEWIGKGDTPAKLQTISEDLTAALYRAINSQTGVQALPNGALHAPPTRFTLGQLEQFTQAPLELVNSVANAAKSATSRMQDLGDIIKKTRAIPASLYGRALDVASYGASVATNFMDEISRTPVEVLANRSKVSTIARTMSYYNGAMTTAQAMATANTSLAAAARRRRIAQGLDTQAGNRVETGDVIAVLVPKATDTWLGLAQRYYQTDQASELAKANGQPTYAIRPTAGVPVVIPTQAVLQRLGQRSG